MLSEFATTGSIVLMQETPIAKLARRWVTRKDRPTGDLKCGSPFCDRVVADGSGIWLSDSRLVACNDDCALTIEAIRRA